MTSSDSEEHALQSRKRSRRSGDIEGGGKKVRGRPRVDTEDATAADRRRTQIRLAQRAYRQRKETTISSLQNQSTQLHSIIEQMSKAFLQLNASTVKSGLLQLNPTLAQEFKHVAETFSSLAKTASDGQSEGEMDGDGGEQVPEVQKPPEPEPEAQHIGWGYSDVSKTAAKERMHQTLPIPESYFSHLGAAYSERDPSNISLTRRRQFTVGEILSQSHRTPPPSTTQASAPTSSEQLPFGLVDIISQQQPLFTPLNSHVYPIQVRIPTPDITPPITRLPTPPLGFPKYPMKSLPPVTTYSFQETTFARRLARAALETGFQLLSNANARPAALNYVFKLSLPYFTLEQMRTRFRIVMSRTIDEDLDWWDHPFIHLGAAGTHYPRRDATGNILPVKNGWTVRSIGPREKKMNILVNTEDGRTEEMMGVDLSDMEGEWFDSHDVQGYLEEKYTCKLDPNSSFAECLVDDTEQQDTPANAFKIPQAYDSTIQHTANDDPGFPSLSHSTSNSSANSSISITPPDNAYSLPDTAPFGLDMSFNHTPTTNYPSDYPKLVNYDISFDQTLGLDLAPGFDYGIASNNTFQMGDMDLGLDMMGENVESLPVVRQKRKKSAWVDVSRLIDEIIKHGVCLGRAPGYRRKDVDRAVQAALIQEH